MDYGKFKYETALKARESRKNQTQTVVKEIKLRPKITRMTTALRRATSSGSSRRATRSR